MKKFSILIILAGIGFIIYGGAQLLQTNQAQTKSLAEAKTILSEKKEKNKDQSDYKHVKSHAEAFLPSKGENVGLLNIPKLETEIAIIEGTHEDELIQGVGHYNGTAYPRQDDQIVLSGHRDTVFRRMGELEIGDIMIVDLPYGEFSYEIVNFEIVSADDRTIIVPTAPDEVLTVTTCYPFSYVGHAPDRYIITALPVKGENEKDN